MLRPLEYTVKMHPTISYRGHKIITDRFTEFNGAKCKHVWVADKDGKYVHDTAFRSVQTAKDAVDGLLVGAAGDVPPALPSNL